MNSIFLTTRVKIDILEFAYLYCFILLFKIFIEFA